MSDIVSSLFFGALLVAALIFAVLFTRCPGLRKALWELLVDVLGDDGEDEPAKKEEEDDEDSRELRAEMRKNKKKASSSGTRRR
mmetsp:Transcript_14037/g.21211  ORF Transcript_14037/g.21211 Transcript_14037/m.21211 type:complete len:84 (-) Transcript_14037:50-301(-)